jgi:hypothetical protein
VFLVGARNVMVDNTYIYICFYLCTFSNIYIYTYIYMYTYIYICIELLE